MAKGYQVRVLDSLDATFDGGEANVAISLARLGIHASFVSAVRDNDVGDAARAFLGTVAAQLNAETVRSQTAMDGIADPWAQAPQASGAAEVPELGGLASPGDVFVHAGTVPAQLNAETVSSQTAMDGIADAWAQAPQPAGRALGLGSSSGCSCYRIAR